MSASSTPPAPLHRLDTNDPRRYDRVRPFTLPASWKEDEADLYGGLLSSASILSGGAMLTRLPQIAYLGLIFSLAHVAHHKPLSVRKNSSDTTGGPWTGLVFSLISVLLITFQKLMGAPGLGVPVAAKKA